jgi:hypothetical protein
MSALRAEAMAMKALRGVIKDLWPRTFSEQFGSESAHSCGPTAARARRGRKAIFAIFNAITNAKHVFVVDHDIDIFDDRQMEWALSTRFQADRDFVLVEGMPGMRMDPSPDGRRIGAKAGFDCTIPFGRKETVSTKVAMAPAFAGPRRFQTVREALGAGPIYFVDIMRALGVTMAARLRSNSTLCAKRACCAATAMANISWAHQKGDTAIVGE